MGSKRSLGLWLLLLLLAIATAATTSLAMALPDCADKCGNVSIPYPFGIGTKCSLSDGFNITCNSTFNPPKPFIRRSNIEIMNISLNPGEVRIYKHIAYNCFDQSDMVNATSSGWINLNTSGPYRFSDTRNKFTAIGCYTLAYIVNNKTVDYTSGCVSFCDNPKNTTDGSCTGIGCCQTSIPKNLDYYKVSWGFKHNPLRETVPCSYAMLVDANWYSFNTSDLLGYKDFLKKNNRRVQLVLDWAVRNGTCKGAKASTDSACRSSNSECYNSTNGPAYLCKCSQGYEGNPYLDGGCADIDECRDRENYPCYGDCTNKAGGYNCTCPRGTRGNATAGHCSEKFPLAAKLSVGISAGVILLSSLSFLAVIEWQKRRFFKQNGGEKLNKEMRKRQVETFRFLTKRDLMKATNNFDKDRILGAGGQGEVYKGILEEGNKVVAIKKSKQVDARQKNEFVNEIIILFQINHRSVVKLLGCCFEMQVPMLVYEFIPNGTLFDFLHGKNRASPISLDIRIEIAVDSAEALSYLHSSTARPILHGDVKSLNILLDANYKAKVSDFGASALVPLDKDQFITLVQGTRGYLDPECLTTQQLTEKSDVYSFGVILLELITRKQAIYTDYSNGQRTSLALSFVSMMDRGRLHDILDDQIVEKVTEEVIQGIAELAVHCLSIKSEDRPTMKEVADRLHRLGRFNLHLWGQKNPEETESLLGHEISTHSTSTDTTSYNTTGYSSMLNVDVGR